MAMGNTQEAGIDYGETYSPVIKSQSLRIMLVIAAMTNMIIEQSDVDTAYLNADLDRMNYMYMPEGYQEVDEHGKPLVLHLLKSLYGLHQSGREWNRCITISLLDKGFVQAQTDPCLFLRQDKNNKRSFMLLYVDDLLIMALTQGEVDNMKQDLKINFQIKELGVAQHIFGMQIEHIPNGIYLGQPRYAAEIVDEFSFSDHDFKPMPMVAGWKHDEESPELSLADKVRYHSLTMKLAYLAQCTRPDLSFTVNTLAQFQNDCRVHDWKALEHAVRYANGTHYLGLVYIRNETQIATLHTNATSEEFLNADAWGLAIPVAYADASYAEEQGRKSRSGHVYMMAGAAVTWSCKKQPIVALSSTEAEYYSLSDVVKEALWMRQLLLEIGVPLNKPTLIHQDNLSTIAIAMNPIQHQRVKHMDVKVNFLHDHLQKEDIILTYCPTEDMH